MKLSKLLVLTDCAEDSVAGLEAAHRLAERHGAALVVGHVLVPRTLGKAEVKKFLKEHGFPAERDRIDVEVNADVASGLSRMLDQVRPDLVVLSSHRRRGLGAILFANTPAVLGARSSAPVLALPHDARGARFRKALVCVDGSPQSQRLVDAAAAVLEDGAEIRALFVVEDSPLVVAGLDIGRYDAQILDRAAKEAKAFLLRLRLERSDVKLTTDQRTGDAVDLILEAEAELRPDLVVLGTAGVGGKAKFVLGKVSNAVLRQSSAPILVVPTR